MTTPVSVCSNQGACFRKPLVRITMKIFSLCDITSGSEQTFSVDVSIDRKASQTFKTPRFSIFSCSLLFIRYSRQCSHVEVGPVARISQQGGQKPQGGHILKYNIGCMQQPGDQTWNGGHIFQMGVAGHHCPPALVEGGKTERRVKKKQNRSKAELLVNNGRFNLVLLKILHKNFLQEMCQVQRNYLANVSRRLGHCK